MLLVAPLWLLYALKSLPPLLVGGQGLASSLEKKSSPKKNLADLCHNPENLLLL